MFRAFLDKQVDAEDVALDEFAFALAVPAAAQRIFFRNLPGAPFVSELKVLESEFTAGALTGLFHRNVAQPANPDFVPREALAAGQVVHVELVVAFQVGGAVVLGVVRLVFEVNFTRIGALYRVSGKGLKVEFDRIVGLVAALTDNDVARNGIGILALRLTVVVERIGAERNDHAHDFSLRGLHPGELGIGRGGLVGPGDQAAIHFRVGELLGEHGEFDGAAAGFVVCRRPVVDGDFGETRSVLRDIAAVNALGHGSVDDQIAFGLRQFDVERSVADFQTARIDERVFLVILVDERGGHGYVIGVFANDLYRIEKREPRHSAALIPVENGAALRIECVIGLVVVVEEDAGGHVLPVFIGDPEEDEFEHITLGSEIILLPKSVPRGIGQDYFVFGNSPLLFELTQIEAENAVGEGYVIALFRLRLLPYAGSVVSGQKRLAGLHGHVEIHLRRIEGGELQRHDSLADIVSGCRGNVYAIILQAIIGSQQVDLPGRGRRRDLQVVIGQQHRIEIDKPRSGREVEGVEFLLVDRINHGLDLVLRIAEDKGVTRQCGRSVALVVRRARRDQAAACSYDTEQYAQ